MGPTTRTFYKLYARAKRPETIVLVNLMFETIGSTTYRLALRTAKPHPTIRQMLTILTRDESFHVPLNVHFLRRVLEHENVHRPLRLRAVYHSLSLALAASAAASRRRAAAFDNIPFKTLARAYTEQLGRLFVNADDLGFEPSRALLFAFGLKRRDLEGHDDVIERRSCGARGRSQERRRRSALSDDAHARFVGDLARLLRRVRGRVDRVALSHRHDERAGHVGERAGARAARRARPGFSNHELHARARIRALRKTQRQPHARHRTRFAR